MTYTLRLSPCRLPSWNDLYASKLHWSKRAELAHYYHSMVIEAVRNQPVPELRFPTQITFRVTQAKRPRDVDNICVKLLTDGLVLAGVLPDDSPDYYNSCTVTVDRGAVDEIVIEIRSR